MPYPRKSTREEWIAFFQGIGSGVVLTVIVGIIVAAILK